MNLKGIMLGEKKKPDSKDCMIPSIWHLRKSKMIGTEIRLMISRRESGRLIRSERVMEIFYILIVLLVIQLSILHTTVHVQRVNFISCKLHFSKPDFKYKTLIVEQGGYSSTCCALFP